MVCPGRGTVHYQKHHLRVHQIRICSVFPATQHCSRSWGSAGSPPTDQPYTQLKDELIKHTSGSEQKRLHLLLTAKQLGDKKTSQLLRKMQQLLGENKLEESILKQLFLKCLPSNIQLILASTSEAVNITQLADLADKIVEASEPAASAMSAVSAPTFPTLPKPAITVLQVQVEQLASQVQALTCQLAQTSFVYAYIDDILVASNSLEQHHQHLRLLCLRLSSLELQALTFLVITSTSRAFNPWMRRSLPSTSSLVPLQCVNYVGSLAS